MFIKNSFRLTMWYVNNITKWMFSKNKEGFRLTIWNVNIFDDLNIDNFE